MEHEYRNFVVMDLYHNFLTGFDQPPLVLPWVRLHILNLSSNMLQGSLPTLPLSTIVYNVSDNKLDGEISQLICNLSSLYALDLSYNYFSGIIPQCLGSSTDSLSILNLRNNNLSGPIPQIYERGSKLKIVDLSQNQIARDGAKIFGELFHGAIRQPESSFAFPKLHIIDLSHNSFTGELPSNYFQTWGAMKVVDNNQSYLQARKELTKFGWQVNYSYSMTVTNKGVQIIYLKILNIFTVIDLSSNQFEGKVSESIGILKGLHVLNLSDNNLIGQIPSSLGNLTELESLDLSQNKLSGEIPQQLIPLTFLAIFNVS
ncbi:receptor-like protein 34 [Cornus florida]|uniref:receptor-like protein 34 n=1 Tax=Cornus florida TaxID=4283 RepID=UPI00289ED4BA|nr:receptor-like protein 34 [Cornus florida]